MTRLTKPEKYNYISKKRDQFSRLSPKKRIIFWWRKGNAPDDYYFKCDTYSKSGYYVEGIAPTLKEAIEDIFNWIDIMDNENN